MATVHTDAETIQGRKLFKGGNYSRKYGIYLLSFFGAEMRRIYFGYVPPLQTLKTQKTQTFNFFNFFVLTIYLLSFFGAEMRRIYFGYVPPLQTLKAQKTETLSSDKSPLDICQA